MTEIFRIQLQSKYNKCISLVQISDPKTSKVNEYHTLKVAFHNNNSAKCINGNFSPVTFLLSYRQTELILVIWTKIFNFLFTKRFSEIVLDEHSTKLDVSSSILPAIYKLFSFNQNIQKKYIFLSLYRVNIIILSKLNIPWLEYYFAYKSQFWRFIEHSTINQMENQSSTNTKGKTEALPEKVISEKSLTNANQLEDKNLKSKNKLQITPYKDYYNQGDQFRNFFDGTLEQRHDFIFQVLSKHPQLCAVYSSRFEKIFFKTKKQCIKQNTNYKCMLYELKETENPQTKKWKFKNGQIR